MDRILGEIIRQVDNKTALMVFSDHGFCTFRRAVHINTWLVQNGFMTLTRKASPDDKDGGGLFQNVDWKNTKAYALGFGSIYLNIKGRERQGVVERGPDAASVADQITDKLVRLTDPKDAQPAIKRVYKNNDIYSGGEINNSPDIVVGFQDGFRTSWQTAVGGSPEEIFSDNLKKWSGDHIVDPSVVPGIFLTNFKINNARPTLMDIAPTVLSCFGMSASDMEGKTLL